MVITQLRGMYYPFSNFYDRAIIYKKITYGNNESAFQAQKCMQENDKLHFVGITASEAKKKGRQVKLRPDWEQIKDQVMYEIVKAKFEQSEDLRQLLISTGDAIIEEGNTWKDKYWGKVDGIGRNKLGIILMRVREELK